MKWEGDWYAATIVSVEPSEERARVHYLGFDEGSDEAARFTHIREACGSPREPGQALARGRPMPPVSIPSGCHHVHTLERPDGGYGMHGGSEPRWWYACSARSPALASELRALDGVEGEPQGSFRFAEHGRLQILEAAPIPSLPRSGGPVVDALPSGTSSWVVFTLTHPAPACEPCPDSTRRHPHSCVCVDEL